MGELNRPNETVDVYRRFDGRNTEQMQKLVADDRTPMNVLDVWERRIDVDRDPTPIRTAWQDQYFDTGDGLGYNMDGELKVVRDAQPLRSMTAQSTLRSGALILTPKTYAAQQGLVFSNAERREFNLYATSSPVHLTENEAQQGTSAQARALRYLLRADEDAKRAEQVIAGTFRIAKDRYELTEIAGFYVTPAPTESPEMRAWFVGSIYGWSVLIGDIDLDFDIGRLVGVAPKAPARQKSGAASTLDANIQSALSAGIEFAYNGMIYRPVPAQQ